MSQYLGSRLLIFIVHVCVTLRILVGSISYTDGGRYYVDGDYGKKLYGAFAGPV